MDRVTVDNGQIKMSQHQHKWAFSKNRRFSPVKILNENISYEPLTSDFEKVRKQARYKPAQPGMGGASARFDYYSSQRKHGALPSPFSHNTTNLPNNKGK